MSTPDICLSFANAKKSFNVRKFPAFLFSGFLSNLYPEKCGLEIIAEENMTNQTKKES